MAQKKMTATVHEDPKHNRVTVVVEHGVAQSFSRAVTPMFHRTFKDWVIANGKVLPASIGYLADLAAHFTKDTEDLPYMERRTLSVFFVSY